MKLRISLAMLLAFCFSNALGQSYSLTISDAEYLPLAGGAPLAMDWRNPLAYYSEISMPKEIFNFFATPFPVTPDQTIGVSVAGDLMFVADSLGVIIDPFFTDTGFDSLSVGAGVSYSLEGGPGNRVLKVEWHHVNFVGKDSNIYVSFQIWLNEGSGTIEMHYGPSTIGTSAVYGKVNGPYVGIFLSDTTFYDLKHIAWLTGSAANPKLSTKSIASLTGTPADGSVFVLTPISLGVAATTSPIGSTAIFPNPVSTVLNYETTGLHQQAKIVDPLGRVQIISSTGNTINVASLPPGCYYLIVESNGKIERTKFVKS